MKNTKNSNFIRKLKNLFTPNKVLETPELPKITSKVRTKRDRRYRRSKSGSKSIMPEDRKNKNHLPRIMKIVYTDGRDKITSFDGDNLEIPSVVSGSFGANLIRNDVARRIA